MKVSDYIAEFFAKKGIGHAFVVTGGCIVHCIDSLAKTDGIQYIPVQHEQAGAMAADSYARVKNSVGLAMATSGPGATNLLTGVCCSYYDSIPVFLVTGQVPAGQLKRDSKSRQIGFQETDVVSIFESVTKYSALIDDAKNIRYELEKAYHLATEGRPGPVLLDICDDVQRANIDPKELKSFVPPKEEGKRDYILDKMGEVLELLKNSERPILIPGQGIRHGNAIESFLKLADMLQVPIAPTWGAMDFLSFDHPLVVGNFGVTSGRSGNFAVQNSDLVLAIGTRLDTHETGPRVNTFARGAKRVMVDIDESELEKFKKMDYKINVPIQADAKEFISVFIESIKDFPKKDISPWRERVNNWKEKYTCCLGEYYDQKEKVNPYVFMRELSKLSPDESYIIPDCGGNLIWTMQGYEIKSGQRLLTSFNHSPMGYAVPGAMGAALATDKPIICITGDGGCQMNIQDLATIVYYQLPVKIFLMNNHGHGIIRQTLNTWLDKRHNAIGKDSGLAEPDLVKVAEAYGLRTISIYDHSEIKDKVNEVFNFEGPIFCNVEMKPDQVLEPKLVFGKPIEDSAPLLNREEFNANMIVPPVD
ncbi:thiamine pyrophosphate-binding protein [Bacteriovoracales bacterium]|nr:thiamine pyrophosphate-binding protein [Bacteriovoracales bacterium]